MPFVGVHVVDGVSVSLRRLTHVEDPGRFTCTSKPNPLGGALPAHDRVKTVAVFPLEGETVMAAFNVPVIDVVIVHR
jgi:hypothetical protein